MYDYVIVGAGSAGCVLANRLSEDPDVSVCLVEAGPPDTEEGLHIPVAFSQLYKTPFDWDFATEPEPALDDRSVYLPRGRVLGGSSSLNAMIYIRGNRRDYDDWRDLGNAGWGWDDVLPYFMRAEDNERGASELPRRRRPAVGVGLALDAPARATPSSRPARSPASRPATTSTPASRTASAATS